MAMARACRCGTRNRQKPALTVPVSRGSEREAGSGRIPLKERAPSSTALVVFRPSDRSAVFQPFRRTADQPKRTLCFTEAR
jgi:hypothetical protein